MSHKTHHIISSDRKYEILPSQHHFWVTTCLGSRKI